MKDSISPRIGTGRPASRLRRALRSRPVTGFLVAAVSAAPFATAAAQEPGQTAAVAGAGQLGAAGPASLRSACAASPDDRHPLLREVSKARNLDTPEAEQAALDALEPEVRRMAAEAPNDVAAQYLLAAVMGARLDLEHGRSKMSGASELYDQVVSVLALDPGHAGANYMMGKLHASVLRLSGVKRFLANTLFGGDLLENASWEEAQARLELAVRKEPCVPEHHFELARVYAQKGHAEGWERELAYVVELTDGQNAREARLRERAQGFAKKWRSKDS